MNAKLIIYKKLLLTLCVSIIFVSCSKNEQSFDYQVINEVIVESEDDSFTREQYAELKIEPTITESLKQDTYSYEWRVYGANSVNRVLSEEKTLDIVVDLAPGAYTIQYTLTNISTGLKSFKTYSLDVVGAFYSGWLVSHNQQGTARLGFIRADGEVFINPASEINEMVYPGTALSAYVFSYLSYASFSYQYFIYFFTTEGAYRFDANDLTNLGTTMDVFAREMTFVAPLHRVGALNVDQFVVDGNGLYVGFADDGFFNGSVLTPFSERLPGDYELFPWLHGSGVNTYFYDNKNKRFIHVQYASRSYQNTPGNATALFDLSNVGKTMIAGGRGRLETLQHLVMEDESQRYIYTLSGISPNRNQAVDYVASPDFDKATVFTNSQAYDHLYYAYNNKLYHYNIVANSAQLLYEFPAGYQIKAMEWGTNPIKLVVGVNNQQNGEVYYFEINELGRFTDNTFVEKFTGFGDIVHLSVR